MIKGIDISSWQGLIDFDKVREDGICFCIVKAGGSDTSAPYIDKRFYENIARATKAGIPCGAYYFVGKHCTNYEAGRADAERFERIIRSVRLLFPVYIDFEAPGRESKAENTQAVIGFCEYMASKGYLPGVYASDISGFKEKLILPGLGALQRWVARYGSEPKYVQPWQIWQASSKGNIDGIHGHVDIDFTNVDYAAYITANHFNGF